MGPDDVKPLLISVEQSQEGRYPGSIFGNINLALKPRM